MILRDYRCNHCEHKFEAFVDSKCPKCGGDTRRLVSAPAFHLEGISGHFPTAADKWARDHELRAGRGQGD